MKILEKNNDAWSMYTDPLREFSRQGCDFTDPVKKTGKNSEIKHEALFQIFDNS